MNSYTARPEHAYLSIFFLILCLIAGRHFGGRYETAFWWGAFFFGVVFLVIVALLIAEGYNEITRTITDFMHEFGKLDDEARAAVAFHFPTVRYHMKRGVVRSYFEDTQVPIEMFKRFLQTSNARYISPQRDWYTTDMPEWAWTEIYLWLVDNKKVVPNSAAGNTSHLWIGNSYQQLMAYWMAGSRIVDMDGDTEGAMT